MVSLDYTLSAVRAQARQIDAGKVFLALIVLLPVALGWSVRMALRGAAWFASYLMAAVRVGWDSAAPKPKGG